MNRSDPSPRRFRDLPELRSGRLLGHLDAFRTDPIGLILRAHEAHGPLVRVRLGPRPIVLVADPDLVEEVLVRNPDGWGKLSRGYTLLRHMLGQGLLTAEGEAWRARRRLSQPAFRRDRLGSFAAPMLAHTNALSDTLSSGEVVDVADRMSRLTLRIVCATLFGADIDREREERVGHGLEEALAAFEALVAAPIPYPDRFPTRAMLRFRRARRELFGVVDALIAERRERPPGDDLLYALITAREGEATGEELRDDVLTLLLAGHETTASALSWTLLLLARHPPTARRVEEELDRVLAGRAPTLDDLPQLEVLDRVLRESMRLYPPAWSVSRVATEPAVLGGYPIPKGTFVFVTPYAVHRNPAVWPDPEGFDPDRWADPPAHKLAWIPFGAGQRKCIGEHFAMLEARLVLATLLGRWRFQLVPGWPVEAEPSVTLRPRHGIGMRVAARA